MEQSKIRNICVYCGSHFGQNPAYLEQAKKLGSSIAHAGLGLVYGGGNKGLMGASSLAAIEAGGSVVGIIPEFLLPKEAPDGGQPGLSELIVTENMHERKWKMFERSDAFVVLPGGIGTLEEIVEMMTWAQLARHSKPMAFVNVDGFWDPFRTLIDHMQSAGFLHTAERLKPLFFEDASQCVPVLLEQMKVEAA